MRHEGKATIASRAEDVGDPSFSDSYSLRDYEVILDLLYGLFDEVEATRIRVFDPFVDDTCRAALMTPRALVDRIEALIARQTDA